MSIYPVITIDGTSGAGKGTVAYRLAKTLNFQLLDSGALYRMIGLEAYKAGLLSDEMLKTGNLPDKLDEQLGELAQGLVIDFVPNHAKQAVDIRQNGKPISDDIRTETVGVYASAVAKLPKVRQALLAVQRDTANRSGVVADGRDMGTVVFPCATAKIFLSASPHARAKRRVAQLCQAGKTADYDQILAQIIARDEQDENRSIAPSRPALDALVIDSSELNVDEVFELVWQFCQSKGVA